MKPQHIDLPRHVTGRVRPSLARAAYLGLALLVACPWPPIAHAQFTCAFTQITDSTGTNVNA
ncbi:MAG TPA: hypothetical protein VFF86_10620, partial [Candidatus Methylomirabilis sp.]|nr:hypothetical protein [Candidatus Methylomirabilis sp.]